MKKKPKKPKGSRGHSKKMASMASPSMGEAYKPKPFSAHFHAEGETLDDLQKSLSDQVGPHINKAKKVKAKAKRPKSVGRALST
jgi:hypothetical protein